MKNSVLAAMGLTAFVTVVPLQVLAQNPNIDDSLRHCSEGRSHVEMRECLTAEASDSAAKLRKTESAFLSLLAKLDEQQSDIARVQNIFYGAKKAFELYRNGYCIFYKSMAFGGNGAGDLTLGCIVMLNAERSASLEWAIKNWKGDAH
jgi:hypothetical protein